MKFWPETSNSDNICRRFTFNRWLWPLIALPLLKDLISTPAHNHGRSSVKRIGHHRVSLVTLCGKFCSKQSKLNYDIGWRTCYCCRYHVTCTFVAWSSIVSISCQPVSMSSKSMTLHVKMSSSDDWKQVDKKFYKAAILTNK